MKPGGLKGSMMSQSTKIEKEKKDEQKPPEQASKSKKGGVKPIKAPSSQSQNTGMSTLNKLKQISSKPQSNVCIDNSLREIDFKLLESLLLKE